MEILIKNISNGTVATSRGSFKISESKLIALDDEIISGHRLQDTSDYSYYQELLRFSSKKILSLAVVNYTSIPDAPTLNGLTSAEIIDLAQFEGDFLTRDQTLQQETIGQLKFPTAKFGDSSNNSEFESDGTLKFNGNATVHNDLNFAALSLAQGGQTPDIITIFSSGGLRLPAFDGNVLTESLHGGGNELMHSYKEGSDISFHIHWMPSNSNSGNVKWQLEYVWLNIDDVGSGTTTITAVASAGTAWKHSVASFPDISGANKKINSTFIFRLFRVPTDSQDTYASDAVLIQCGVHYETDMTGSRQRFTK